MNKILVSSLSKIALETTLRADFGYMDMDNRLSTNTYYTFDDLFYIVEDNKVEDFSTLDTFGYAEIGNTNSYNQVSPNYLNWDDQNEINEPLFKKIKKGDIIAVQQGDILISKVRPYLKKFIYITEEYSKLYFTSAFIHIRPKKPNILLYYALKSCFLLNLMAISRQGKGYPTISAKDLKYLKFQKTYVDRLFKNSSVITPKILTIESKINCLFSSLQPIDAIVNDVFLKYIKIPFEQIESDYQQVYYVNSCELDSYDIRTSFRFNNPKYQYLSDAIFQYHTFADFIDDEKTTLGRQMSPDFIEEDSDLFYINTNSIKLTGFVDSVLTPISAEFYNKNQKLKVEKGDILLIASGEGSIGRSCIFDCDADCITSQFIMKIHPKKDTDTEYLNFFMHSFYFQFCVEKFKKGKGNMTNIFVSQLLDFPLYYPDKNVRERIVAEVRQSIEKRDLIIQEIENLRNQIDTLLEEIIHNIKD